MTTEKIKIDHAGIRKLYHEGKYISAWEMSRSLWDSRETMDLLDVPQLTLAGRLAERLGGGKISRLILRTAAEREPASPHVRFYCRYASRKIRNLFDDLQDFDRRPALGSQDPEVEADWFCWQATIWSGVRDFRRAEELIDRAEDVFGPYPYSLFARAQVLFSRDLWEESLLIADQAWQADPTMFSINYLRSRILAKLNHTGRLIRDLERVSAARQSFDLTRLLLWYQLARAEKTVGERGQVMAEDAYDLALSIRELAPLADRRTLSLLEDLAFDAAMVLRKKDKIELHARSSFGIHFGEITRSIQSNPSGRFLLIDHQPVNQKYDTCLPAAAATVLSSFGIDVDHDELARRLTFGGTPVWRMRRWAEEKGLKVFSFTVTRDVARRLIDIGIPFVFCFQQETFSHAVAVVGWDEFTGLMIVHDPSSERRVRMIVERIDRGEAPLGPQGLVLCPENRAERVLRVLPDNHKLHELAELFWEKRHHDLSFSRCIPVVERLRKLDPDHPITRRLEAILSVGRGNAAAALKIQREFLKDEPDCLPMKIDMLFTVTNLHNTRLSREVLENIVEEGVVPGLNHEKAWEYPPTAYLLKYARIISRSDENISKAMSLVGKGIRRDPYFAENYHVLADLFEQRRDFEGALLARRIASGLAPVHSGYLEALAFAYRRSGKEDTAITALEERVRQLGDLVDGGDLRQSLIRILEIFGRPEAAIRVLRESLEARPDDIGLRVFAARFWTNWAFWDEAARTVEEVRKIAPPTAYASVATEYFRRKGLWRKALPLARDWVRRQPNSREARQALLELFVLQNGQGPAVELARSWYEENPDHEMFRELLYLLYGESVDFTGREKLIRQRIKESPEDAWAWRELGNILAERMETTAVARREDLVGELEGVITQAVRTGPHDPATMLLEGRFLAGCREYDAALEKFLRAMDLSPDNPYCFFAVWECASHCRDVDFSELRRRSEQALTAGHGFLVGAPLLVFRIAERFGLAEAMASLESWRSVAGKDPFLSEAHASALLNFGGRREEWTEAIEIARNAVEEFPYNLDLRLLLARAFKQDSQHDLAEEMFLEVLRRDPTNGEACRELASFQIRKGHREEGRKILEEGIERNPGDGTLHIALADLLWNGKFPQEALEVLRKALEIMPENIGLRDIAQKYFFDAGFPEKAVGLAREGVEAFPEIGTFWYLLGKILDRSPEHAGREESREAYLRALSLDASLMPALEELIDSALSKNRFDEAKELLEEYMPGLHRSDRARAMFHLADIRREQGEMGKALEVLRAAIVEYPFDRLGRQLLLDWLAQHEDTEALREAISDIPESMLSDPEIHSRVLIALQQAGEAKGSLDERWSRLCSDFPDNQELALSYFDFLVDVDEISKAVVVLDRIGERYPDSTFILQRRVYLFARWGEKRDAIETAIRIWTTPGDERFWPESASWYIIRRAGWVMDATKKLLPLLKAGENINGPAFSLMLDALEKSVKDTPGSPDNWDARTMKQRRVLWWLGELLEVLVQQPRVRVWQLSEVLDTLNGMGGTDRTLGFLEDNRDLCRSETPLWARVGRALNFQKMDEECCNWMKDWRTRDKVPMWALLGYCGSLRVLGDVEEIFATCRDALGQLEHDHSLPAIATYAAFGALMTDRMEELHRIIEEYHPEDEERWENNLVVDSIEDLSRVFASIDRLYYIRGAAETRSLYLEIYYQLKTPEYRIVLKRCLDIVRKKLGKISFFFFRIFFPLP